MRILPNRKMRLDGLHIVPETAVDVSPASAALAIRNGWASAQPEAAVAHGQEIDPPPRKRKTKADA